MMHQLMSCLTPRQLTLITLSSFICTDPYDAPTDVMASPTQLTLITLSSFHL